MPVWLIIILAILAIVFVIGGTIAGIYNSLVRLDERVNEAWSDITVQLKYRADLIPNVVETVKGYAKHEKETFHHPAGSTLHQVVHHTCRLQQRPQPVQRPAPLPLCRHSPHEG